MALQKTVTLLDNFDIEVSIPDCYIRVTELKGGKALLFFMADYHKSAEAGSIYRKRFSFSPSVSNGSENFIKQAYEHLKTLPEFANAEDV